MAKKSKRNSGPKVDSGRAAKLAARQAERDAASGAVNRPFEGLAAECDLVAMREFVPSATAPLPVIGSDRPVTVATVLPALLPHSSATRVRPQPDLSVFRFRRTPPIWVQTSPRP